VLSGTTFDLMYVFDIIIGVRLGSALSVLSPFLFATYTDDIVIFYEPRFKRDALVVFCKPMICTTNFNAGNHVELSWLSDVRYLGVWFIRHDL